MDGLLGFIIFIVICAVVSAKSKQNSSSKTEQKKPLPVNKKPAPAKENPQRPAYVPKQPTANTSAPERKPQESKYYDSTCITASSEHDHNQRLEQLDAFLKDGIIEKEEYRILKEKYERYN